MEEMEHEGSQGVAIQPSYALNAKLKLVGENLESIREFSKVLKVKMTPNPCQKSCVIEFSDDDNSLLFSVRIKSLNEVFQCGSKCVQLRDPQGSAVLSFHSQNDTSSFLNCLHQSLSPSTKKPKKQSVFSLRTEDASANQYFQFYGFLSQQQNMMQDYVRTSTYQSAMLQNMADFSGKVVIDVGAGSGILSFFAVQAGAKKVYAVEASSMAVHCQKLVQTNNLADKVTVIAGKIEEVDIPEPVDMIISEPMGYMLFNERMLESYIHARKWLKPEGKMFPSEGILYCAPFTDELLYLEQCSKASFWGQQHFHGVDVSSLKDAALEEYFKQPIVDTFDFRILVAKPVSHSVNFLKATEASLHVIDIPFTAKILSNGCVHGLAFWFDILFDGSQQPVWLSTSPSEQLTHWYQIRCLLRNPILCFTGQELTGSIHMVANERQSYDVDINLELPDTRLSSRNKYDLKNPYFRYTSAQQIPPGTHHTNPTEAYLASLQTNSTQTAQTAVVQSSQVPVVNGNIPSNTPYVQYPNNMTAYSTTSVYGHPLMTPGTSGGLQVGGVAAGGGANQLWYPGQSNAYDNSQMYYYKPTANHKGSGFSSHMIPSHS